MEARDAIRDLRRDVGLSASEAVSPKTLVGEPAQDRSLRPARLDEFVGQELLKENLAIMIGAARKRGEPLEHLLFYGPPGLGKTTLAHLLAREIEADLIATSGPALERASELVGLLTSLPPRGVLFIDEIHRTPRAVEEYLYSAMEDFRLDIMLDRGPAARSVQLHLPPFTLIGATTRVGLLTSPLRGRFGHIGRLDFYGLDELCLLLRRSAALLGSDLTAGGARAIARCSRGTPRIANRLLRRARDFADVKERPRLDETVVAEALALLRIDGHGLHEMDRRLLRALVEQFAGGPAGLGTLAAVLGEEEDTVEDLLEPFLIQQGLIERTRKGRTATPRAFELLGVDPGPAQDRLL